MQDKQSITNRLWQATNEGVWRTVQKIKQLGRGVVMVLVAGGAVVAGIVYAARKKIASLASTLYQGGRRLFGKAFTALTSMLPPFVFGGI